MRIVFLVNHCRGDTGGIQLANYNLEKALAAGGHSVHTVYRPDFVAHFPGKRFLANLIVALRFVLAVLSREHDLLLIGHLNLLKIVPILKTFWIGASPSILLVLHGVEAWDIRRGYVAIIERHVSKIITVSHFTRTKILEKLSIDIPVDVVYNACRLEMEAGNFAEIVQDDTFSLIFIGRLAANERYKGLDELLDTLAEHRSLLNSFTLTVIGDGDDFDRVSTKSNELGLDETVRFLGAVSESRKIDELRRSNLLVLCGSGEGFGIVLLEAAYCGVPVLGSVLDATAEVIRLAGIGFIADPRSRQSLLDVLLMARLRLRGGFDLSGVSFFSFDNYQRRVLQSVNQIK